MSTSGHYAVLLRESVELLIHDPDGAYVDGTFGRGGHSRAILRQLASSGRLIALDKDPQAIAAARELAAEDARFDYRHGSFAGLAEYVREAGLVGAIQGVLLDLGVSSPQLDDPERGFSFLRDGPLDMRMDPSRGESAAQWLNRAEERDIARVLKDYGEERFARRIAGAIVRERAERPFERTGHLAEVVKAANPKWERDKHPATRAFQAIRIYLNAELEDLEVALDGALDILAPGGRLVVISFHSLEDRMVKRFFRDEARGKAFPKNVPVTQDMVAPRMRLLGKQVRAGDSEVGENPRSRSAVMRAAEKL